MKKSALRSVICVGMLIGICTCAALFSIAGCSLRPKSMSDLDDVTRNIGIKFPANVRLEEYTEVGERDIAVFAKIVTDKGGMAATLATLPTKTDHSSEWPTKSTTSRLGMSNYQVSHKIDEADIPSWWNPDSLHDFTAGTGLVGINYYYALIGGRDPAGRYVMYVYYCEG